uniref:Uncharacterized LOC103460890 n=1 Tax=Poecilia reticulata TaxID=8081 RepID=A0A3P9NY15_POERE
FYLSFSQSASNKPRASLTVKDTIIPVGGSVALTCSVDIGESWKIYWFRHSHRTARDIINNKPDGVLRVSDGGVYSCRGGRGGRGDPVFYTEYSTKVTIHETGKLVPVLSVSPSWLNPGASVTLSCEVKYQDAGWRFFWYKAVPDSSVRYYRFELLPNSTNGTEQNYIINGPTHTAGFVCRAGRGEPVNYTEYSEPKFVWSADPHPAASLSVNPDRVQHFRSESVSLSCEGNSTWRVMRFTETDSLSDCSIWGKMNGSTSTININQSDSGVYWCESGSGEFSNAVNITVHVTASSPVSSSFPVMLIIRPVVGIVVMTLLFLLWRFRRSRDLSSNRLNQAETQNDGSVYSSLLHGDSSLYETIQLGRASGNVSAEMIHHPAEDSDYDDVDQEKQNSAATDPAVSTE